MIKFQWLMLMVVLFGLGACSSLSEADRIKMQQEKANAQKAESDKSFRELDRVTK